MSLIKSIKQVLGLSVTPSENYHWDGSVANKLVLKRGVPGAEGVTVLEADAAIAKFPAMLWADGAPVVERGSNANGEYVRFADGTMICFFSVVGSSTGNSNFTLPAPFITSDWVVSATPLSTNVAPLTTQSWVTSNSGGSVGLITADTRVWSTNTASCVAIGRWK